MAHFLQTGLGFGPPGAGLRLLPGWVTLFLVALFAGPWSTASASACRSSPRWPCARPGWAGRR
jgi:hypothetical protein